MKLLKQVCILTLCFFLYLWFGAFVFHYLEKTNEAEVRMELVDFLRYFKETHSCIDRGELKELIIVVIKATENGVFQDLKYNNVNDSSVKPSEYLQWDIFNSFFFSSTVVTTIGYGNLSPKTVEGRSFCIIYALIGIPFTGWLLNVIGKYFVESWKNLANRIMSNFSMVVRRDRIRKYTAYITVACLVYAIIIIIPSIIFMCIEGWTFFQAQYFCFISLTTIGFGDFVICNNPSISVVVRAFYKIAAVIYLIFGLSVLMITLKGIGDMETKNARSFGNLSQKIKKQVLRISDKWKETDEDRSHENNNSTAETVASTRGRRSVVEYKDDSSPESTLTLVPPWLEMSC